MGLGLRKQDRALIRFGTLGKSKRPLRPIRHPSSRWEDAPSIAQAKIPQGPRVMQRIMRDPAVRRRAKAGGVDQL